MILIYLVERASSLGEQRPDTSVPWYLPVTPEEITLESEQRSDEFPLRSGSVIIPRGVKPRTISFDGFFPGDAMRDDDLVVVGTRGYLAPSTWVEQFTRWMQEKTPLSINISETPASLMNLPVFIESFKPSWSGGFGNVQYSIAFREIKDTEIKQYTAPAKEGKAPVRTRHPIIRPRTYTVRAGDTLMLISKKTLGDATRWREFRTLNSALVTDPLALAVGTVLRVPRG